MDGERRSPAEAKKFWELAIGLWANSGLGVAEFCRREGINTSSFYAWQKRFRNGNDSPTPAVPAESAEAAPPEKDSGCVLQRSRQFHPAESSGSWMPVRVVGDGSESSMAGVACPSRPTPAIEIILPQGVRICIDHHCDGELLKRVLIALEVCPC
jgi:transposase-like protein